MLFIKVSISQHTGCFNRKSTIGIFEANIVKYFPFFFNSKDHLKDSSRTILQILSAVFNIEKKEKSINNVFWPWHLENSFSRTFYKTHTSRLLWENSFPKVNNFYLSSATALNWEIKISRAPKIICHRYAYTVWPAHSLILGLPLIRGFFLFS